MQAQTINKKQQKNTLSAKKKKKQTIKTVLASPYESYWPLLSTQDHNCLIETLKECLPRIRPEQPKIPYKDIKNVPKNERKQFRQNYSNPTNLRTENDRKECSNLIFGVNSVTISIEKQQIGSILIANEVQPRNLVQHVIDMAVYHRIPVLIVNDLKKIINDCCGITTAVFGCKNLQQNDLKTNRIHQMICNLYEHYPIPSSHMYFNKLHDKQTKYEGSKDNNNVDKIRDKIDVESLHLHRDNSRIRVFIPQDSSSSSTQISNSNDFLELSNCNKDNDKSIIDNVVNYRAMIVKRLKGNKNRDSRKMVNFKKKKNKK